jgi:hypothetical protein
MVDKLSIYNGALRELKETPLASLTENRPIRKTLDTAYDEAVRFCLESGIWTFAMRDASITQSGTSSIGYDYVFTKPSDFLKLAGIWSDSSFKTDIDDQYDEYGDSWRADYTTIYIKYVSNHTSYGLDLDKWTGGFIAFVQKYLAFLIASTSTNSDGIKKQMFELAEDAKNKALELDAWKKPVKRVGILGSTTPTKLSIYNRALSELGQPLLLSLNENNPAIEHLDTAYNEAVRFCLENGQWNFAMRTVKLDYNVSVTPSFGYQKFFQKPADYIKLIGIWYDEDLKQGLAENYDEDNMGWYTDYETIYVKYVSNHANYGLNFSTWTSAFTDYVQKYLAFLTALPITQSPQAKSQLFALVKEARLNSQNLDNWNKPTKRIPQGSWASARTGGRYNFSRERY